MATINFIPSVLRTLPHDGWLLFVTRFARLFAYGSLSVILVFYLVGLGFTEAQAGLVLTLTLVGDVVVSLYLTTRADRIGRRRMLIVGSILMAAAGLAFACTSNLLFLVVAGTIGVMDVPTRQSYTMAVVPVEERSAAGGFTGVARTTGAAISPLLAGFLFARPSLVSAPFFIAGMLKIVYDLLLYFSFQKLRPPEES
jgi:MFS family permease